jgi:hypothetical protein
MVNLQYFMVIFLVCTILILLRDASPLSNNDDIEGNSKAIEWRKSDHLECDIYFLGLDDKKLKQIENILNSKVLQNIELIEKANKTEFFINHHLVYRYLMSVGFADNYHGRKIEDAIVDTVEWRESFGISKIDTTEINTLVKNGLGYTSNILDKEGRAITYVKIGRNEKLETSETYLKFVMYTIERADKMSVSQGSGQFIAIVDLSDFNWSKCPSISMIKDSIGLLKKHYPYRLGGIFILNGGTTFNFLWSMIKPIMPKRALLKTHVLNKKDEFIVLDSKIGIEYIEDTYGGKIKEDRDNLDEYFRQGFWGNKSIEIEVL